MTTEAVNGEEAIVLPFKLLKAVSGVASIDKARKSLMGVRVARRNDVLILQACDGRCALSVEYEQRGPDDEGDFIPLDVIKCGGGLMGHKDAITRLEVHGLITVAIEEGPSASIRYSSDPLSFPNLGDVFHAEQYGKVSQSSVFLGLPASILLDAMTNVAESVFLKDGPPAYVSFEFAIPDDPGSAPTYIRGASLATVMRGVVMPLKDASAPVHQVSVQLDMFPNLGRPSGEQFELEEFFQKAVEKDKTTVSVTVGKDSVTVSGEQFKKLAVNAGKVSRGRPRKVTESTSA